MEKNEEGKHRTNLPNLNEFDVAELVLVDPSDPTVSELFVPGKVCLSKICELGSDGYIVVNPLGTHAKVRAVSALAYTQEDVGKTFACMAIQNNHHVMIVGEVSVPEAKVSVLDQLIDGYQESKPSENDDIDMFTEASDASSYSLHRDEIDEELVFEADRSILFKCGDSSISLSADGRVHIRGKFVTNSASQLNRVSGGTVKIN